MRAGFRIQDSGVRKKLLQQLPCFLFDLALVVLTILALIGRPQIIFGQDAPKSKVAVPNDTVRPARGPGIDDTVRGPVSPTPAATAPVALDAEFTELYGDYALLRQEIERIETATGQVTIPQSLRDLAARAQAKEKRMQAWVNAHHVGAGWVLNWQDKRFEEPAKKQESGVRNQESGENPKQKAEVSRHK